MLDESKDEKALKEACVGLCQLFGEGIQNDRIQAILEANVVPKLVALLRPSRTRSVPIPVQSAALQVLGNVACGDDRQTQVVIDSDALPCLRALLSSSDRGIRKEVCWIVSNITESSHQVQDVLDADILPPLLKLLDNQDPACREDATWVLFNLSSNRDPRQISYLAEKNGVRALCNLLTCSKELDVLWKGCGTVAAVALKGLRNILICGQNEAASDPNGYNRMAALVADAHGVERIEALTAHAHASHDVQRRARLLLERMFGAEPTTVDLSSFSSASASNAVSSLASPPPPPPAGHTGCSCSQQHHNHHGHQYQAPNFDSAVTPSNITGVDPNGLNSVHAHSALAEGTVSTSASSSESDPEDEDSDSDLIPPPPAPCNCLLCTESAPLVERRPRGKGSFDDISVDGNRRGTRPGDMYVDGRSSLRTICNFCSGGGRLGDGRAGLAAKLGRAVRLGHSHCLAILLSRMTWSQRAAATEAPALLHPGGGPPDGGVGSSFPAIILAAQLGKPECLALLLRRCKPDLDVTHGKRRLTPLAWASHKGYVRCTELLIQHGADPSKKCGEGVTALHLAASGGGNVAICKMLIANNAPVNARSGKEQTPLFLAAQKGHSKIVQVLLSEGAKPNIEDEGKYTPLHQAASGGFVECVEFLISAGAKVDAKTRKGGTPLRYAVQGGHAATVRLLVAAGAKVNCTQKPLLLIAADDGNREVVQILLDALANIDCKASIKASLDKDNEVSDYLTPLHLASSKGNTEVVELLLHRGALVDAVTQKSGWAALDFAVLNGHADCAELLLKNGATVSDNCKSIGRNNWTLVQYAANHGAKEVVRLLIQRLKEQRVRSVNGGRFAAPAVSPNVGEASVQGSSPVEERSAGGHISLGGTRELPPLTQMTPTSLQKSWNSCEDPSHNHKKSSPESTRRACPRGGEDYSLHTEGHASVRMHPPCDSQGYSGGDRLYAQDSSNANGASADAHSPASENTATRRHQPKEDRQATLRARELRKREMEAAEARDRLDEAISQRSTAKLTEAIAHVSKLVLQLATSYGGDSSSGSGAGPDHGDGDSYGSFTDPGATGVNSSSNNKHPSPSSSPYGPAQSSSSSLAMEVGLGNEVQKARKILAELLAEERRLRDERAKEVEDTKRENAQQTVQKNILTVLQGGDPRVLSRAVNRATRIILDSDDPFIVAAEQIGKKIAALEKSESDMRSAMESRDLDRLSGAIPLVQKDVERVLSIEGEGAALRIFGGKQASNILKEASLLCEELKLERENAEQERAEAENREQAAFEILTEAMDSSDLYELESALHNATEALISKESDRASLIESAKRMFAKALKIERRKLRQANSSNEPDTIDKAVAAAQNLGLKSLEADIESARELAGKLREQAATLQDLEDAISSSDTVVLAEIRNKLTSLGMFSDAERARAELDVLQRAARARTLLKGAISDAQANIEAYRRECASHGAETSNDDNPCWVWPDTQRLYDLAERSRKYGPSLEKLCDSANEVLKLLASLGREILNNAMKTDDARRIAAAISGYEKSFMSSSCSSLFGKDACSKILSDARKRLAFVQAKDQAKIKAESAQVKVEYALANSRRSAARTRSSRGYGGSRQHHSGPVVLAHSQSNSTVPNTSTNGAPKAEVHSNASTNSSDYGGDDEASDLDGISHLGPGDQSNSNTPTAKASELGKHNGVRRPRIPPVRFSEDWQGDDSVGDNVGGTGDCSHYYMFKEGSIVECVRCGNLRNSTNPEWLGRVKRRGGKPPPDIVSSPPRASGSPSSTRGSTTSAVSLSSVGIAGLPGHLRVEKAARGMRSQNIMLSAVPPQMLAHSAPLSSTAQPLLSNVPQTGFLSHVPVSSGVSTASVKHGKSSSSHRGRGRPHSSNPPVGIDGQSRPPTSIYGRAPISSSSLPMHTMSMPHPLPAPFRPDLVNVINQHSGAGLAPLAPGLPVQASSGHMYSINGTSASPSGDQHLPPPLTSGSAVSGSTHPSLSLMSQPASSSEQGVGHGQASAVSESHVEGNDDFTAGNADLGLEFASENFGFNIDEIVDDAPPPQQPRPTSSSRPTAEASKMYIPNTSQPSNGYY